MTTLEAAGVIISTADTAEQRRAVQSLFSRLVPGTSATAVPTIDDDHLYAPVVLQATTTDGRLVGGALALRAPMAVWYFVERAQGSPALDVESELDRVSNVDLVAVEPDFRGIGVGTALLADLEQRIRNAGARVWFGGISRSEQSAELGRFFENRGFRVLEPGSALPHLLGRRWTVPHTTEPLYWFYKKV